jgi:hypothetical protein
VPETRLQPATGVAVVPSGTLAVPHETPPVSRSSWQLYTSTLSRTGAAGCGAASWHPCGIIVSLGDLAKTVVTDTEVFDC